jgi:hypothetical protein
MIALSGIPIVDAKDVIIPLYAIVTCLFPANGLSFILQILCNGGV